MRTFSHCLFDTLESRTLLSGGSSHAVISDRAHIAIDVKLMHADTKAFKATIKKDQAAIRKELASIRMGTKSQIKADKAAFTATLKADHKAILTTRRVDLKIIKADNARIRADGRVHATVNSKVGNPTVNANVSLEAQDEAQLQLDEQKMNDDLAVLDAQLQTDETQEAATIAEDQQKGEADLNGADPILQAEENQLNDDEQQEQTTLQADAEHQQADEVTLEADLNAEASGISAT